MATEQGSRKALAALPFLLLAVFYLYLTTVHPVFKNDDSPETTAAAVCLGIGHPPGYPLYTMMGKIATLVPLANPAFRMNLLSVILSMLVLAVAYATAGRLAQRQDGAPREGAAYELSRWAVVAVLATSYIFWDQSIGAKGGIYILNLFFTAVSIHVFIILLERFHIRYFYLLALISGLALANHWPSFVLILPAAAWFVFKWRGRFGPARLFFTSLFFLTGLSAYLYLPLRAVAQPPLNWGDPSDPVSMFWVILRKAYAYPVKPTLQLYAYQVAEFLKFTAVNYGPLAIPAALGVFALWKKDRKVFWTLGYVFAVFTVMVVFYNRTKQDVIWLMHIFLMPAAYAMLFFIMPGIRLAMSAFGSRLYRATVAAAAVLFALTAFFLNLRTNYSARDFVLYDYGRNILRTLPQGALYMASGDYNAMPVYYAQQIEKYRTDVRFATDSFLLFKWGIDDLYRRTGDAIQMTPMEREKNIRNLVDYYAGTVPVYRNFYWEQPVALDRAKYPEQQEGLLVRIGGARAAVDSRIFDRYIYRGVADGSALNGRANGALATWYPACMVNAANALMEQGDPVRAIELNRRALAFPVKKPEGNIAYNIAMAYNRLDDRFNELAYLEKASELGADIPAVYERLGVSYYEIGMIGPAEEALKKAQIMGDQSQVVNNGIQIISGIAQKDRDELGLMKASENLMTGRLNLAQRTFTFLLEKGYKRDIIYKNLGVYHFRTKDYQEALRYFKQSENATPDPGTSLYIVITYETIGQREDAIREAGNALKKFPADRALADAFGRLTRDKVENGKSTDSVNGQR